MSLKQHCLVVYLDLKSAYDKVYHEGLLYKLSLMNIKGNMLRWILSYLKGRNMKVRIGREFSCEKEVKSGVPQGAVLSPLLFNVMLADMPTDNWIESYCYADDLTFSITGENINDITRKMQRYINKLVDWVEGWGMQVSQLKCSMQIYSRSRNIRSNIKIKNYTITHNKDQKILGIIFDAPYLTWKSHIEYLCTDVRRRLDIMKVMRSTNWGAASKILRIFYISYIRSKIDYGSCIYGGAAQTHLTKLDKLQNSALRMIIGA